MDPEVDQDVWRSLRSVLEMYYNEYRMGEDREDVTRDHNEAETVRALRGSIVSVLKLALDRIDDVARIDPS